ncbi:hypothetical protein RQN30_04845 [Arcanobacterium hippocoleae]
MIFWPAPALKNGTVVNAEIAVPASKSLTNRYLILAALSADSTVIHNPLDARDTLLMVNALRALGVQITQIVREPENPAAHKAGYGNCAAVQKIRLRLRIRQAVRVERTCRL